MQRQLNLYGFKCISRGEDKGAFFHPKFRRGDWEVVKRITRYAPMKRSPDTPTVEKVDNAVIKLTENQVMDSTIPVLDVAPQQDAAEGPFRPTPPPAAASFPYNPAVHYPHFDAFFHHPDFNAGHNWHWPVVHPSAVYPHGYVMKGPLPQPLPLSRGVGEPLIISDAVIASDIISSEPAVPPKEAKSFINVVNRVVTVDPYFDLGDEFDLFQGDLDADAASNQQSAALKSMVKKEAQQPALAVKRTPSPPKQSSSRSPVPPLVRQPPQPKRMVDVGVNTIITQSCINELFQMCHGI